nr:hypothetical protein [Tanacetum cinerariifolium]
MTTRSAGRPAAASRRGGTGGRAGRGDVRTRGCSGDQGDGRIDGQGGQVGGQGSEVNDGVNGVLGFSTIIVQQLRTLLPTIVAKVGLAMRRILIGSMSWLATKLKTIQKVVQIAGTLTDEALRNGSIKKNPEKRGNKGEPRKDKNLRDDKKRTRTGNAFAITTNPVRRENTSAIPKCTTCNFHHPPETPCRTCFNCNCPGHFAKDCRVVPRNVNPINARNPTARAYYECDNTNHVDAACPRLNQAQRPGGNHQNQVVAINEGQGHGNNNNHARGRASMLGAEEARQDTNIVTGTFTLNNHYASTLFDYGADYSFVPTNFIPMLGIEPSDLRFSYEIEIASGQLVEINMVIKGCKLEKRRAEIICHEKVVRMPLPDCKVLRCIGERPNEKVRHLVSAKAKEHKRKELVVVRYIPEVFLDDLLGLPPIQEIEFQFELVPRAIPIMKSPYRLAPSEMEELSGQLKEL